MALPAALVGAGCQRPSDAVLYAQAAAAADFTDARGLCRDIRVEATRDDCLLAVLEAHQRLSDADCAEIHDQKWYAECLFQLAERQSLGGDLALGLATCDRSRFARPCAWHLLQDQVQATLDLSAAEAEPRIDLFKGTRTLPDAPEQFWLTRFREQGGLGRPVDEADCATLRDPDACRIAVASHVRKALDALGRASLRTVCDAEPGQRAMTKGRPAWVAGPTASAEEARWVAGHCR